MGFSLFLKPTGTLELRACYFCLQVLLRHCLQSARHHSQRNPRQNNLQQGVNVSAIGSTELFDLPVDDFIGNDQISSQDYLVPPNLTETLHPIFNEEQHVCPMCLYTTNSVSDYQKHLKGHQVKQSKCPYCSYSTNRNDHLKIHIRSHTGEKPYMCKLCDYKSAQKSHLNVHMQKRHRSQSATSSTINNEPLQINEAVAYGAHMANITQTLSTGETVSNLTTRDNIL